MSPLRQPEGGDPIDPIPHAVACLDEDDVGSCTVDLVELARSLRLGRAPGGLIDTRVVRDEDGAHPLLFVSEGKHANDYTLATCTNDNPDIADAFETACYAAAEAAAGCLVCVEGCLLCPDAFAASAMCTTVSLSGGIADFLENCGGGFEGFMDVRPEANVGEYLPQDARLIDFLGLPLYAAAPSFGPEGVAWSGRCFCGGLCSAIPDPPQYTQDPIPASINSCESDVDPAMAASFLSKLLRGPPSCLTTEICGSFATYDISCVDGTCTYALR